jgi:4-amino-4-deoxy-L-arabinose transferase-like glycosyltransferase
MQKNLRLVIVFISFLLLSYQTIQNINDKPIHLWDEARGALNAIEMMQSDNYIVVSHHGKPDYWNSKPPLSVWLKVISYKIFGINEFSVRLASIIAIICTAIFILWFFVKNKMPYIGALTVIFLASVPGYMGYHVARNGDPDALLTFFVIAYSLLFYRLVNFNKISTKYYLLIGVLTTLAIYTKSFAALVPVPGLFIYGLFKKNFYVVLKDYRLYIMMLAVLLIGSLYYVIRNQQDPNYIQHVLQSELGLLHDHLGSVPKHPEFTYYINYIADNGLKVFIYFLPLLLFVLFPVNQKYREVGYFCIIQVITIILIYSSAVTKNAWYIATVYPYFSILISVGLISLMHTVKYYLRSYKYLWLILNSLILTGTTYIIGGQYYQVKQANTYEPKSMYHLEWNGAHLSCFLSKYPKADTMKILSLYPQNSIYNDQLNFYIKRYQIEQDQYTMLINDIEKIQINDSIIVCREPARMKLDTSFYYSKVDSCFQCMLAKIDSVIN